MDVSISGRYCGTQDASSKNYTNVKQIQAWLGVGWVTTVRLFVHRVSQEPPVTLPARVTWSAQEVLTEDEEDINQLQLGDLQVRQNLRHILEIFRINLKGKEPPGRRKEYVGKRFPSIGQKSKPSSATSVVFTHPKSQRKIRRRIDILEMRSFKANCLEYII